ncbi:MAG: YebC/PmpR family DNA-binding transcriptional regulator [Phycisphaeraceae bacterium]|nr:YebC/PmpR family DNA-binding transcriptional regulator [Phycisphaeraceae bacterium]MCW5753247.1 YebC/PmpR family DNA-binding transcriptional regulator [Phycisphaeraceae bacterium]
MAGHNKWSKIKHRKAAVEKKKTKIWSKISKAIMVAARNGGPDPESNLSLRYAIDEARYANMPKDTIQRAIDKGAGAGSGDNWEHLVYEGYGPGGAAVLVDALTDNRTRTAGDLRLIFGNHGGNLGTSGCVSFMFSVRGQLFVPRQAITEEALLEAALEAGADDVISPEQGDAEGMYEILTSPSAFGEVRRALESKGVSIEQAEVTKIAENTVVLRGEQADTLNDLLEALDDNDDVQKVYSNAQTED